VRVAMIICIGVATIAAAIGADGLGVFIFRGVAMVSNSVILAGVIPAALLAIVLYPVDLPAGHTHTFTGTTNCPDRNFGRVTPSLTILVREYQPDVHLKPFRQHPKLRCGKPTELIGRSLDQQVVQDQTFKGDRVPISTAAVLGPVQSITVGLTKGQPHGFLLQPQTDADLQHGKCTLRLISVSQHWFQGERAPLRRIETRAGCVAVVADDRAASHEVRCSSGSYMRSAGGVHWVPHTRFVLVVSAGTIGFRRSPSAARFRGPCAPRRHSPRHAKISISWRDRRGCCRLRFFE
jgi:hypothetical protein